MLPHCTTPCALSRGACPPPPSSHAHDPPPLQPASVLGSLYTSIPGATTQSSPGLGLAITALLLTIAHLVLFSREHCACCGAPPGGAAAAGLPLALAPAGATTVSVTNTAFKAQSGVTVVVGGAAVVAGGLPPNWIKCGPEPASGDYWYGAFWWWWGLGWGEREGEGRLDPGHKCFPPF
jgi:hypothetical protein